MKRVSFQLPDPNKNDRALVKSGGSRKKRGVFDVLRREFRALVYDTKTSFRQIMSVFTIHEDDVQAMLSHIDDAKKRITLPPIVDVDYSCIAEVKNLNLISNKSTFAAEEARTAVEYKIQYELLSADWVRKARSLARQQTRRKRRAPSKTVASQEDAQSTGSSTGSSTEATVESSAEQTPPSEQEPPNKQALLADEAIPIVQIKADE
jgi:hypothetical protein